MNRSLAVGLSCVCALGAQAQWGVRFNIIDFTRITSFSSLKWHVGVGADLDTSPRTSLGMDVTTTPAVSELPFLYLRGDAADHDAFVRNDQGDIGFYSIDKSTSYGFQLRSAYFFSDNAEAAAYVAMSLGVRRYSVDLELDGPVGTSASSFSQRISATRVVVPVIARVGVRGDLRKLWSDVFFGLGYQIGAGPLFKEDYPVIVGSDTTEDRDAAMVGFTVNFGWSFGFGGDVVKNGMR